MCSQAAEPHSRHGGDMDWLPPKVVTVITEHCTTYFPFLPPQIYSAASNVGVRMKAENGAFINKNYS